MGQHQREGRSGMRDLDRDGNAVLVVDDEPAVAGTIGRWLERGGFECEVAHSVHQALEICDGRRFGIVLTDIHMPGRSGLELARTLKARDPEVQIIVVTGSTTLDTAIEAMRLDTDDYLLKPLDFKKLLHAVGRAAEHRRLLVENRHYRLELEERVRKQAARLEALYLSSIHSLVSALEAKDVYTRGHSERVGEYAVALAERIGGVDTHSLRVGARLHDIGKIGVASGILGKDGPLEVEEMDRVREHPSIGVEILAPLLDDRAALNVVRYHHERWDGAGYPDGLAGEDIPLEARIVAVADTFDAMTTSRPYRAALTVDQAVAEIRREAGRQFDPGVVACVPAVFLRQMRAVS